jgi:predicted nucleic acid-binding protein
MAVVTNASPLILYARIGRLDVLHSLFSKLLAPDAVMREVVTGGSGRSSYSARSSLRGRGETSVLDSFRFW